EDRALADFDWKFNAQSIDRAQIEGLATGQFVRRGENLVMVGQSGVGKSHLLQALARRHCELGYRVRYIVSFRQACMNRSRRWDRLSVGSSAHEMEDNRCERERAAWPGAGCVRRSGRSIAGDEDAGGRGGFRWICGSLPPRRRPSRGSKKRPTACGSTPSDWNIGSTNWGWIVARPKPEVQSSLNCQRWL
ncbi:MAG: ATP-binding protein, partial [Phycisphaerae bacterium]|nr:ATP-binding protein [Phycisphaerae bacterium]